MSYAAVYTTKRNDHANWERPSRRRGTYFGTFAAPKESIRSTTSGGHHHHHHQQQQPQTHAQRHHQSSPSTSSASASSSAASSAASSARKPAKNAHTRTQQFLSRVSKKRLSGKFTNDDLQLFRRKNAELEEHLDALQKNFDELQREHFILQGEHEITEGNVEELNNTIRNMVEENKRVNGLLILEKARSQNAAEKTQAVEDKFTKELDEYKELTTQTIQSLETKLEDTTTQLETAQRQLREMFDLKEENQRRREECKRMKQSLVKAKAYTLHKALNATVAAGKNQASKMQRIIAHLQAEHVAINAALEEVIAERNVLRTELERRDAGQEAGGNANAQGNKSASSGDEGEAASGGTNGAVEVAGSLEMVEDMVRALQDRLAESTKHNQDLARYSRHLENRLGVATSSRSQ